MNPYGNTVSRESREDFLRTVEDAAKNKPNVYFVAAHDAEIEFAKVKYPHMDVSRWRTIYPIGHESKWLHREMMAEHKSGSKLKAEPFKSETLCVYPSANEPGIIKEYQKILAKANVHYESLGGPG